MDTGGSRCASEITWFPEVDGGDAVTPRSSAAVCRRVGASGPGAHGANTGTAG